MAKGYQRIEAQNAESARKLGTSLEPGSVPGGEHGGQGGEGGGRGSGRR
jgi:hypothetical protein